MSQLEWTISQLRGYSAPSIPSEKLEQWKKKKPSQLRPVNEPTARGKEWLCLQSCDVSLPQQIKGPLHILP